MPESIKVRKLGKYILHEKLGEGSMGSVWLSQHTGLGIPVAIKLLNMDLAAEDPDFLNRFTQEGRLAGQLNHNNIVRIYDAGMEGSNAYIVMEYIEGCDTLELLEARGALPAEEVLGLAIGVAEALKEAHSLGIIHRDIKPDNILATVEGRIKLADLGLAKQINDDFGSTMAGTALGTPYYISPEQALDALKADARSDIYSLGATLYHLLSGFLPYEGDNVMGVMLRHTNEPLVPPQEKNPDLPLSFCKVICKMMEKDPANRYQNCDELLDDLFKLKYGNENVALSNADLINQSEKQLSSELSSAKSVRVKVKIPNKGKYAHKKDKAAAHKKRSDSKRKKTKTEENTNKKPVIFVLLAILILAAALVPSMLKNKKPDTAISVEVKNSTKAVDEKITQLVSKEEKPKIVNEQEIDLLDKHQQFFEDGHEIFIFKDGLFKIDSTAFTQPIRQTLISKKTYKSYTLEAEFMFEEGYSDSGIHFHANNFNYFEIQMGVDCQPRGGSFLSRGDYFYVINGEERRFKGIREGTQKGAGEWNILRVKVENNYLEYSLNGIEIKVPDLSVQEGHLRMTCWNDCNMTFRKLKLTVLD